MPSDRADWSVRADELQAAGDPWGRRIALWIARESASNTVKLELSKELAALEGEHREYFFGPELAELLERVNFAKVARLSWEYGYISEARISMPHDGFEGPKPKAILRALVRSPAAKHLRALSLGTYDYDGTGLWEVALDIASGGPLAQLERLSLGDFQPERDPDPERGDDTWAAIGDVSPLYVMTPKLHTLRLRGAAIALGKLEHPTLAHLEIETGGLPSPAVKSLAAAELPELVHMDVSLGREDYGGTSNIALLRPIFTSVTLPKLRHLGLESGEMQDQIAVELAKSPLLAQLESVDLSSGTLHRAGVRAILRNAASFEHLWSLDLRGNFIPDELREQLVSTFGPAVRLPSRRT